MDCTPDQTEFLMDLEAHINNTTPSVRYECQSDRILFSIPSLIQRLGVLKEGRVHLCDLKGNCLTEGATPEESVQKFKVFVDSLLSKHRI